MHTAVTVRQLLAPVYLPWGLTALGMGMLVPVLPLYLRDQGLSFSTVSVVLAAAGFGAALGGLPVASALSALGERRLLLGAIGLMAITAALVGVTTAVLALVANRLAFGAGTVGVRLSLQSALTRSVPPSRRGRAMSLMGGTARLSFLLGPLLGGWLADLLGYDATFVVIGGVIVAAAIGQVQEGASSADAVVTSTRSGVRVRDALVEHRTLLLRTGPGPALVMTVRGGRMVVVPLIGDELGMSATAIGGLVAIGAAADLLLFPVAGYVMDRHGRLWAMVPAFAMLGSGLLLLSFANTVTAAVVAGVVMGIGNGLSSGTMLTLGSDLAPHDAPGPFLAAFAAMQDTGKVLGPLLVGWFADAAGLGASAFVLALAMFVGLAWIVGVIGETRSLAA